MTIMSPAPHRCTCRSHASLSSIPPIKIDMLKNVVRYRCWLGRKEPTWDEIYKEHRKKAGKGLEKEKLESCGKER